MNAPTGLSSGSFEVSVGASQYWSYAYASTRRSLVRAVSLRLTELSDGLEISVFPRIRIEAPFDEPISSEWMGMPKRLATSGVNVGEPVEWDGVHLEMNYVLLGRLEERVVATIVTEFVDANSEEIVATSREPLTLLGRQDWYWDSRRCGDTLAAFVNTRSPVVRDLVGRARQILQEKTGDSSTEGYQREGASLDPSVPHPERSRSFQIAQAVYEAIQERQISYSNPPSGFDAHMQRIRTPDEVLLDKAGTCLDTSVLLASCLAEAGLEPVIFLVPGHAFAGFFTGKELKLRDGSWVVGDGAVRAFIDSAQSVAPSAETELDWIAEAISGGHLQPIETTTMCSGLSAGFVKATSKQNNFSL
jgi:hypothetical protein